MKRPHCAFFFSALGLFAQQPQAPVPSTPKVDGRVINIVNGEPVRKASVSLQPREAGRGTEYSSYTDSNGHFVIEDVEPGVYTPIVERTSFKTQVQGAPGARPEPITVATGQDLTGVTIRLIPLGVITGRLLDEDGDPIQGATLEAMTDAYVQGKKQLRTVTQTQSNHKGDFRLYNLEPGSFYLRAQRNQNQFQVNVSGAIFRAAVSSGSTPSGGYAPTYYPSTTEAASAAPIVVAAGAQLKGIDIQMRKERFYAIRGKASWDQTHQLAGFMIVPVHRDQESRFSAPFQMENDIFEFRNVMPGSYIIAAARMDGEKRTFARAPMEIVNADIEGIDLIFAPGTDVAGVVRVEGTLPGSARTTVSLQSDIPSPFGQSSAEVKPDGSFELKDLAPEAYRITVSPIQAGSYLKSVRLGDQKIEDGRVDLTRGTDSKLILTLGTDVGQIEGKVQTAGGDPAVRVRVTCIPYGNHLGRGDLSRFAFTDEKGFFRMPSVPPGEYKLFAWEDVPMGAPQDPEFRKRFEKQSIPMKMAPGAHEKVELTAIKVAAAQEPVR